LISSYLSPVHSGEFCFQRTSEFIFLLFSPQLTVYLHAPRQVATMSKTGALDLASGLGGKINKEGVKSAVDEYVYTLPLRDPAA
jgi:hypothetical protein